jgi:putative tryptophan/tyrosine transport system substrate-binding protein
MRRREFITLLGGAAAWPLAARAQQPALPVIGFVNSSSLDAYAHVLRAFRQGLKDTGYLEGANVTIEYRWAEGQYDRLPALAADLLRRQVAVIVANGPAAPAAKEATSTIPIVFVAALDPVEVGLVASLNRRGGNLTGVSTLNVELLPKRLGLLHDLMPTAARVALLVNPVNAAHTEAPLSNAEAAARAFGLQVQIVSASTSREIDAAFTGLAHERVDALFVFPDLFFFNRRVQMVQLAARHAIPATYPVREFAEVGGLMSYGTSTADAWRRAGAYTGRILKGAKPADLPVVQAIKFELVINHQTARMLGLEVPPTLLAIADEVIE